MSKTREEWERDLLTEPPPPPDEQRGTPEFAAKHGIEPIVFGVERDIVEVPTS